MLDVLCKSKQCIRDAFLVSIISLICYSVLGGNFFANSSTAYAHTSIIQRLTSNNCLSVADPTSQSMLVVLLDRSGSLTQGTAPTDPNGYSTSVTKALADLWPGKMAIVPFSGDTTPLSVLGPATLSDPTQRAKLKDQVQNYQIDGDTPLGPAMHQALDLLHQQGTPIGSRVIVITDGNPTGVGNNDGPHQEQDIHTNLIRQYCSQGIPIDAFGLKIDTRTSNGQDANRLLGDITKGTGATYTNVRSPEELAQTVISLYAQWQHLNFTQEKAVDTDFNVSIDSFAQQVNIVTFRSESIYAVTLSGPDGHRVTQGIQESTDRHYQIDSLDVTGTIVAGTYTVNTSGDPNAQVYVLVSSPLQVQLVAPTSQTKAYTGKAIEIQAQFLNGHDVLTPQSGQAQLVAHVTLLVNGQPEGPSNDVVLTQQAALFIGQTLPYTQTGTIQFELLGTYQQVKRETSFTLQLLKPPISQTPPSKQCGFQCQLKQHIQTILLVLGLILLILFVLWVLWRRQQARPKPYGYLTNGRPNSEVELARFRKPTISSDELQAKGNFNFGMASFDLVFPTDGKIYIRAAKGNSGRIAIDFPGQSKPKAVTNDNLEIKPGRKIYINDKKVASFETSAGKRWT